MTTLDPRYVSSTPFQWVFRDKDTGLPLASGIVTFYEQDNQTVKKPIYQIDNSSPTGFSELNNPITLTGIGTFADDNGNDIVPYFFPFDADGNIELYHVVVESSSGVLQFTRDDWPPNEGLGQSSENDQNDIINYVPNGQFLLHNNNPTTATIGSDTVSYIAQGGWTFEKESTSTSTDTVSFIRKISASTNPNVDANPRYYVQIATNGPDANYARKDLCLTFPDVNKFSGDPTLDSSNYTLSFQGNVQSGGSVLVDVRLRKNFGTGGSASTDISLGTISIFPTESLYNLTFTFGENSGDNVGTTLDDDFLQICIRLPNSQQTVQFTDVVLTPGSDSVVAFPQTPNADFIRDSTVGWLPTPNPDGSNLYLPIVLTAQGCTFDDSCIGNIITDMSNRVPAATLYCDGSSYSTTGYSTLGIPYSRLFAKLFVGGTSNIGLYGTGVNFVNMAINSGATSQMVMATNKIGLQTTPANGATSPTFTYTTIVAGSASIGYKAFSNSAGVVTAVSLFSTVPLAAAAAGTSGMVVEQLKEATLSTQYYAFRITALSAAALGNGVGVGKYFTFSSNTTSYYMWFQTATETDPAPGGTGIKILLPITMAVADVSSVIANALAAHQLNTITTVDAGFITPGAFFTFNANSVTYTVWYSVGGSGSAPVSSNLIKVTLAGTETAAQVATATQIAINSMFFAVPDLRGLFLRGTDPTAVWDFGEGGRGSLYQGASSDSVGSLEIDQYGRHDHALTFHASNTDTLVGNATPFSSLVGWNGGPAGGGDGILSTNAFSQQNGFPETAPVNVYVNWYIKY